MAAPSQLHELQRHQAKQLLKHAATHVPYYREHLKDLGINPNDRITLKDWNKLPLLSREEVQQAGDSLKAKQIPENHGEIRQTRTSGSTGRPITVYTTEISRLFWAVFTFREHLWHQRHFEATFTAIRSEISSPPGHENQLPNWGKPVNLIFNTGPAFTINIRTDIETQAKFLLKQDPTYLLSFPTNIKALAKYFQASKRHLKNPHQIVTYGEIVDEELRQICRETWNAPVKDMHSSVETGYIAIQCPQNEHYHTQEGAIVEILNEKNKPCSPGEIGRVVVTPLHNFAMPLIRYEVGDYAEVGEPCSCGRGLSVLRRIMGRERNMLTLPDGRQHWPSFPADTWAGIAPIRQIQLIQHDLENIESKIVAERALTEGEQTQLIEVFQVLAG